MLAIAPVGTQVQLRCSVVQEYGVRWVVTSSEGITITTAESDSLAALRGLGISVEPFTISAQKSVLTVNRTEGNNGTTVVCVAVLLANTTMRSRCSSEEVQVFFYGINVAIKLQLL